MSFSREGAKPRRDIKEIACIVVDTAFQLHKDLGTGLLESVYEGASLIKDGLKRVVNHHTNFASSRLRVHQKGGAQ